MIPVTRRWLLESKSITKSLFEVASPPANNVIPAPVDSRLYQMLHVIIRRDVPPAPQDRERYCDEPLSKSRDRRLRKRLPRTKIMSTRYYSFVVRAMGKAPEAGAVENWQYPV